MSTTRNVSPFAWLGLLLVSTLALIGPASAYAVDPLIVVSWGEPGDPPALGLDYFVSTTSPASLGFPDVRLQTGSLTWRIWSKDTDNPGHLGDIGVITSPHPEHFGLKIEDDLGNVGARDVKGIILSPTDPTKHSNITGGSISRKLTGDLVIQQDSFGAGGEVDFTVVGNLTGNITVATIPSGSTLTINGDVSGTVGVTNEIAGGTLTVVTVTSAGSVTVADMTTGATLNVTDLFGRLTLPNGVPVTTIVSVLDEFPSGGIIDLNGAGVGAR